MNRLGFRDFHTKHFGPDQRAQWQVMLQQQQYAMHSQQAYSTDQQAYSTDQQPSYDSVDQSYPQTPTYPQQPYYTEHGYYDQEHVDNQQYDDQYDEKNDQYEEEELSKEAIEIFRFSEAYRKEREVERLKEQVDDQEGMQDWQYDESTVHVSGGMEAPATSLVLINKRTEKSDLIKIQEELLNTAYLASCTSDDIPVILWPVLPFKM
ncbi:hypothetical protein BDF21DRAFT_413907 [Thamnidium elegans]|uniref:Uncharacterized protein n=1 Tax=Thamnidium elegans TaxID=101142 RepID=A0A8H7VMV6_9FUNG|nr:hypothetical protein INT48_008654 [Thamnidium elegans]KAI8087186.1 hypothetical protein BDF21DRAFT_413907 [Thamnidium elegans]